MLALVQPRHCGVSNRPRSMREAQPTLAVSRPSEFTTKHRVCFVAWSCAPCCPPSGVCQNCPRCQASIGWRQMQGGPEPHRDKARTLLLPVHLTLGGIRGNSQSCPDRNLSASANLQARELHRLVDPDSWRAPTGNLILARMKHSADRA